MLTSEHVTVATDGGLIVWRFSNPNPYRLLFLSLQEPTNLYTNTRRGGLLLQHSAIAPYGAMQLAARIAESDTPENLIERMVSDGMLVQATLVEQPSWASEEHLYELLVSPDQKAIFEVTDQTFTLEC